MIHEMIRGIRESVYELIFSCMLEAKGSRMGTIMDIWKIWGNFLGLMILNFLPVI